MPLFDIAITEAPTPERAEKGDLEKIIVPPKTIVAKDKNAAALKAITENATVIERADADRVQVHIRPFA